MLQTFSKIIMVPKHEDVWIDRVRFLSEVPQTYNNLLCSGCGDRIGKKRPIAMVSHKQPYFRAYRLCYDCSKHLKETENVS